MSGHGQNRRKRPLPSIEALRAKFSYDPETGQLSTKRGPVGSVHLSGYVRVTWAVGYNLLAHRVAWALMKGYWPHLVHHINEVKIDNRWCNLAEKTCRQNIRASLPLREFAQGLRKRKNGTYRVRFKISGRGFNTRFRFWRDAVAFRAYLDQGFEQHGEAFQPVIPPRSQRLPKLNPVVHKQGCPSGRP